MNPQQVLIIGNEGLSRGAIRRHLEQQGCHVEEARSGNIAQQLLRREPFDVVLIDDRPGVDTASGTQHEECRRSGVPILYWTHLQVGDEAQQGSLNLDLLSAEIERIGEITELKNEVQRLRAQISDRQGEPNVIGESAAARNLVLLVQRLAEGPDSPVLLEGEDGTGKRLVARMIHRLSERGSGPFVEMGCHLLEEAEAERQLFGIPARDEPGKLAQASGGTLYLRDVDGLPLRVQHRLRRQLIEESASEGGLQARWIASTRFRLDDRATRGAFDPILFEQLARTSVPLPTLRERRSDIPLLADRYLQQTARDLGRRVQRFSPEALEALCAYDWPGNVAELRNVIDRLVLLHDKREIALPDLPIEVATGEAADRPSTEFRVPLGDMTLEQLELQMLKAALEKTGHNQVRAAHLLGVSRDTLRYRMKKFGLLTPRQRRAAATQLPV